MDLGLRLSRVSGILLHCSAWASENALKNLNINRIVISIKVSKKNLRRRVLVPSEDRGEACSDQTLKHWHKEMIKALNQS